VNYLKHSREHLFAAIMGSVVEDTTTIIAVVVVEAVCWEGVP
jgi:hypothetical protein